MAKRRNIASVGAYDAKTHFSEILQRVEGGEEVTITRHGAPVARLVPIRRASTSAERRTAIEAMRALSASITLGDVTIGELIREGRR